MILKNRCDANLPDNFKSSAGLFFQSTGEFWFKIFVMPSIFGAFCGLCTSKFGRMSRFSHFWIECLDFSCCPRSWLRDWAENRPFRSWATQCQSQSDPSDHLAKAQFYLGFVTNSSYFAINLEFEIVTLPQISLFQLFCFLCK